MAWGDLIVERDGAGAPCKLHAVFLPFAAYSHVVQFLHFARLLVREHGFTVTIITSTHFYKEVMKSHAAKTGADAGLNDGILFSHLSDKLPDDHPRLAGNLLQYVMAVYAMESGVNALLSDLQENTEITCVVRDLHLPFALKSIREAGIPIASFAPNSAMKEYLNRSVRALIDAGYLPDAAKSSDNVEQNIDLNEVITCLDGAPSQIRVGDLPIWPSLKGKVNGAILGSIENRTKKYVLSDWVVINTPYELERDTVDAMRKQSPNICTVGPLSLADYHDDAPGIPWLDQQAPRSVVVLAFGSTTQRSIAQFQEVAMGLEASEANFLWVFSPDQVGSGCSDSERASFLEFMTGFSERTAHRGHITKWVSKFLATLRHPAVGAFVSHCGWVSVLEGISSGVPFLTWPFQYDHWPPARCITHVWRVGLSLESEADSGLVSRDDVAHKVRRILGTTGEDPEIDAIRERSENLKCVVEKSISKGGSSHRSLASFVAAMRKKVDSV